MRHADDRCGEEKVPQRERVLRLLRNADAGLAAVEIAAALGIHVNTVRSHLQRLADSGLVRSSSELRTRPGRPRVLYRAADGYPGPDESYRFIAGILAGALAVSGGGLDEVERAGAAWGRLLVAPPGQDGPVSHADALARVLRLLEEHGFDPVLRDGGIAMRRCPFADLVEGQGAVICRAHLGILRGALDELGASLGVERLRVFPEPGVCVAQLAAAG